MLVLFLILLFSAPCIAAAEAAPVRLPILRYHRLTRKQVSRYAVSPEDFEKDLQFLAQNGYTTITVNGLLDFTHKKKPLPGKPVMLTFDDGCASDYVYAFPLLKKYNAKAVFFFIGKYADIYSAEVEKDIEFAHLSWRQIKEMKNSGLAEFQSHTYDLNGADILRGPSEGTAAYEERIQNDFKLFNKKFNYHLNAVPTALASPLGLYDGDLKQAARGFGFSAVFTTESKMNLLTGDPRELYGLGRFSRTDETDMQDIARAVSTNWAVTNATTTVGSNEDTKASRNFSATPHGEA